MKLRIQTDYALRTLMYLGHTGKSARSEDIANVYLISKDHLVKVIQQLAKHGYVQTTPGRGGGVSLARPAEEIVVRDVIEKLEERPGLLDCFHNQDACRLEPGCRLRRLLIRAEQAFYDTLSETTIAELCRRGQRGGLTNLRSNP